MPRPSNSQIGNRHSIEACLEEVPSRFPSARTAQSLLPPQHGFWVSAFLQMRVDRHFSSLSHCYERHKSLPLKAFRRAGFRALDRLLVPALRINGEAPVRLCRIFVCAKGAAVRPA
jgi:hypothetical protein